MTKNLAAICIALLLWPPLVSSQTSPQSQTSQGGAGKGGTGPVGGELDASPGAEGPEAVVGSSPKLSQPKRDRRASAVASISCRVPW